MKKYGDEWPTRWRHRIVLGLLTLILVGLIGRMVQLMVVDRAFLLSQGDARALRTVAIPAYRGIISDRNGEPLAISTPVSSVWMNPKEVSVQDSRLQQVSKLIGFNSRLLKQRIKQNKAREFIYLKRGVNPTIANAIKLIGLPGLFLQGEFHRFYPEGEIMAHILGITNIDDHGIEGLELSFDNWLRGIPGKKRVVKDRIGRVVDDLNIVQSPKPGNELTLSIDRRIQYLAYRELQAAIDEYHAESGSIIVMNVTNGEVLAMVNQPSFNPNSRLQSNQMARYRNRAVTDVFEPGSALKPFAVANALASGNFEPTTLVNTAPGFLTLNGHQVKDRINHGKITVETILQISSNVGVSKLVLASTGERLYRLLHRFGFGEITESGFPGESMGRLPYHSEWEPFTLATLGFGYGISVTALQLANAYAILGSGGIRYPVTFLKTNKLSHGVRVITANMARQIVTMMESVVARGGTAPLARVPGYRVSGKTGTTRIVGKYGYEKNRHNSIFVGLAPASQPRLVVAVVIHDPRGKVYYGGRVAAPIFAKVMGGALRILNVAPDDKMH